MARNSNNWELNTDFEDVKRKVIDKISKGSYIEDVIGNDFDFVNKINKIKLKVGDEVLKAEKIEDNKYGFGKNDNGDFRYVLEYKIEEQNGEKVERLILNINETVFPTEGVTLEYYEKLVNKPKTAGTYKYNTNESATLYPVDAKGKKGKPMVFPVPTVEYKYVVNADNDKMIEKPKTSDSSELFIYLYITIALVAFLGIAKFSKNK